MPNITIITRDKQGSTHSLHTQGTLKKGVFLTHTVKGKKGHGNWRASGLDEATSEIVWSSFFREIDPNCKSIELPLIVSWSNLIANIRLLFDWKNESELRFVAFDFDRNFENWATPYSIKEYVGAVHDFVEKASDKIEFKPFRTEKVIEGFSLICPVRSADNTVRDEVEHWSEKVKALCTEVVTQLLRSVRRDSLVTFFDFPAPIKTSCQQYLIYFAQFLEDLGIRADSELKEEAGRVLFSVTPKDGPLALGQIREALGIYLDLPQNPEFSNTSGQFSGMAVAQLKANVLFLQSQLALGQAMLETKNATIEALNFTLYQQRQLLTGPSVEQTMANAEKESESEPILGDTVHLTKYEGKFLKVDLPTILRRLKRSFGIGEKKDEPEP